MHEIYSADEYAHAAHESYQTANATWRGKFDTSLRCLDHNIAGTCGAAAVGGPEVWLQLLAEADASHPPGAGVELLGVLL